MSHFVRQQNRGLPLADPGREVRAVRIDVRATEQQKARWQACASIAAEPFSEWTRIALDERARDGQRLRRQNQALNGISHAARILRETVGDGSHVVQRQVAQIVRILDEIGEAV